MATTSMSFANDATTLNRSFVNQTKVALVLFVLALWLGHPWNYSMTGAPTGMSQQQIHNMHDWEVDINTTNSPADAFLLGQVETEWRKTQETNFLTLVWRSIYNQLGLLSVMLITGSSAWLLRYGLTERQSAMLMRSASALAPLNKIPHLAKFTGFLAAGLLASLIIHDLVPILLFATVGAWYVNVVAYQCVRDNR